MNEDLTKINLLKTITYKGNWIEDFLNLENEGLFVTCADGGVKVWNAMTFEVMYTMKNLFENCYCRAFWEYFPKICSIGFFYESGNIRFFNVRKRKWTI